MCERYVLPDQATAEREFVPARAWWSFTAKYNVAAQQYVPAVRWHDGQSEAVMLRWGFIPSAPEARANPPPLTIDLERIIDAPMYRTDRGWEQSTLHLAGGRILCMATDQCEIPATLLRSSPGQVGIWIGGNMGSIRER